MKIYRITMDMPYRGNEPEKRIEDVASVTAFFNSLPSCERQSPERADEWFVEAHEVGAVMIQFIGKGYGEPHVKGCEIIMDTVDPAKAVSAMLDRVELAASRIGEESFNGMTQSPLSGPHLRSLNRLLLLENCCTDELQCALDHGWRMIAVCPQEARRPDYVLGRCTISEKFGSAARTIEQL